ncbi:MAG: hypothetical protein KDC49_16615 [Saprospiraceae bacterium]|nr:hypothetical protein [Saprospiraceae bacterium]
MYKATYWTRIIAALMVIVVLWSCKVQRQEAVSMYKVTAFKNAAYICHEKSRECFFIQYQRPIDFQNASIQSIYYGKSDKKLYMDFLNGQRQTLGFDGNIFGLGQVNAIKLSCELGKILIQSPGKKYIDLTSEPEPQEVSSVRCSCILNEEKRTPKNWVSGGNGAIQCGVNDAAGRNQTDQNMCKVYCDPEKATAFCTMEPRFIYLSI